MHTSHIRIDLGAISANIRAIGEALAPGTLVCPVIKADAYGLGADRVAGAMVEAGARRLAVFTLQQAAELESRVSGARILALMPVEEIPNDPRIARLIASGRLELVVSSVAQATRLGSVRLGRSLPVHVEVDCGMGRGGVSTSDAPALLEAVRSLRSLDLVGIFTHFTGSDPAAVAEQGGRFDRMVAEVSHLIGPRVLKHAASSGPCFADPSQQRDMVRIGLGWTGWLPLAAHHQREQIDPGLRPAVTWRSRILQVRELEAGSTVGYGSRWTAPGPTRVGLVPVGYAHGYPMLSPDSSESHTVLVSVGGGLRAAPVVGAVSMDQMVVDLGGLEDFDAGRDREVILLSDQLDSAAGLHAISARCGIPPHMVLSSMATGIPRVYLTEGMPVSPPGGAIHLDSTGDPARSKAVG